MPKAYQVFKISLLIILVIFVVIIISYEAKLNVGFKFEDDTFLGRTAEVYTAFRNTFLNDPYNISTLDKINGFEDKINWMFDRRVKGLSNFTAEPQFDSQMLSYFMFKNADGSDFNTTRHFGRFEDFTDLILIDSKKNLIYKYGAATFSMKFYDISNRIEIINFPNYYGIIQKKIDSTLDYEYEAIALFDYSELETYLKNTEFASFIYINDTLLKNKRVAANIFAKHQNKLGKKRKVRLGLKVMRVFSIGSKYAPIGYCGIIYPVRSFVSYLLIAFKILVIATILFVLFMIDRIIARLLTLKQTNRKMETSVSLNALSQQKNQTRDEEDEEIGEKGLDWVEHYIHDSEVHRK